MSPGWRRYFKEIEQGSWISSAAPGAAGGAAASPLPHVQRVPLFRELPAEAQARVAGLVEPLELPAGAPLFRAGDPGDSLYVVTSGELRVERAGKLVAVIGAGEVAGELAVIEESPRSADVVAEEEPLNMGAWPFLRLRGLRGAADWAHHAISCVARPESASPAVGSASAHKHEQAALLEAALGG